MIPLATGMAISMTPLTSLIMSSVPLGRAGIGSAMNDTTRELGGALGVAVLGSIVTSRYAAGIADDIAGLPEQARDDRRHRPHRCDAGRLRRSVAIRAPHSSVPPNRRSSTASARRRSSARSSWSPRPSSPASCSHARGDAFDRAPTDLDRPLTVTDGEMPVGELVERDGASD